MPFWPIPILLWVSNKPLTNSSCLAFMTQFICIRSSVRPSPKSIKRYTTQQPISVYFPKDLISKSKIPLTIFSFFFHSETKRPVFKQNNSIKAINKQSLILASNLKTMNWLLSMQNPKELSPEIIFLEMLRNLLSKITTYLLSFLRTTVWPNISYMKIYQANKFSKVFIWWKKVISILSMSIPNPNIKFQAIYGSKNNLLSSINLLWKSAFMFKAKSASRFRWNMWKIPKFYGL
jgi:hypothetical protein